MPTFVCVYQTIEHDPDTQVHNAEHGQHHRQIVASNHIAEPACNDCRRNERENQGCHSSHDGRWGLVGRAYLIISARELINSIQLKAGYSPAGRRVDLNILILRYR